MSESHPQAKVTTPPLSQTFCLEAKLGSSPASAVSYSLGTGTPGSMAISQPRLQQCCYSARRIFAFRCLLESLARFCLKPEPNHPALCHHLIRTNCLLLGRLGPRPAPAAWTCRAGRKADKEQGSVWLSRRQGGKALGLKAQFT